MAGREQPYDPYIPSGSAGQGQGGNGQYEGGNPRTAAIQSVCLQTQKQPEALWGNRQAGDSVCFRQEFYTGFVRSADSQSQALAGLGDDKTFSSSAAFFCMNAVASEQLHHTKCRRSLPSLSIQTSAYSHTNSTAPKCLRGLD